MIIVVIYDKISNEKPNYITYFIKKGMIENKNILISVN